MESWMYNPEQATETLQRRERRELKGCSGCRYRGERVFGRYLCRAGLKPGPAGYCRNWTGDDQ